MKVLSIAVFIISKRLTISLLSQLEYLILKYLILFEEYNKPAILRIAVKN